MLPSRWSGVEEWSEEVWSFPDLLDDAHHVQHARPDLISAETVADRFVSALELEDHLIIDPFAAAAVLDARLRAWGRRACSAVVSFEPELVLRVPLGAKLIIQAHRVAHELGHVAADFDGVPRPHDEDWIDHVAAAIWLRRRGVRRALERWGWDGPRLLRAFGPEVPAEITFRRVATVGGGLAILRSFEVSRRVFAPEHIRVHDRARGWEQRWMRTAMYGGEQHGFEGEGAWPFHDELEGRGGLILMPPWALETGEEPREIRQHAGCHS